MAALRRSRPTGLLLLCLAAVLLALALSPAGLAGADSDLPAAAIRQAWERANATGRYHFDTATVQVTHPTPHPANAGRRAGTTRFDLSGDIDGPARALELQLWPYGRERSQSLQVKVAGGRAYGRTNTSEAWMELQDAAGLFTGNGNPLGYLAAAVNIRELHEPGAGALFPNELLPDALDASITRYRFDLDGLAYARAMRDLMQAELRRSGELPAGMTLGMVREYVDMVGEGELWLDANGLPYRQLLHIRFPAGEQDREWTELRITTDYGAWQPRSGSLFSLDWSQPRAALHSAALLAGIHPDDVRQALSGLAYCALLLGATLLLLSRRRSRALQAGFSLLIIASLLIAPLLQVRQVSAFLARQEDRPATAEPDVQEDAFDPHADPLVLQPPAQPDRPVRPDAGRTVIAAARAATDCVVSETSDCDGDNLQDKVEIFELGTFADEVDTDNDGITDDIEVLGFDVGGQNWYMNPRDPDSNRDGLPDGMECPARHNVDATGAVDASVTAVACADTDNDGVPDVWDFDNDADGVPDAVDDDPYSFYALNDQQFSLNLAGYEPDASLLVDISVRPSRDEHLWWTNNYLDWPDLDQHGQITRVTTDTLGTDGDMMLSPLLEITIPYNSDNPSRGLPVQSGVNASSIAATDPIAGWLDTATLDLYGMTVTQDSSGTLVVYAPLSLTKDIVGDTPVAWTTRIYYEMPSSASGWGSGHEVRVLWTVNGLLDQCTPPDGETFTSYCDVGSNRENTTNLSHWTTVKTVYQTYYDDFMVTALSVQEEQGVDAAVIAQKSNASGGSASYANYLWHLGETLEETFLQAQLISGQRMSVADIGSQYPNWGIPAAALSFEHLSGLANTTDLLDALAGDNIITRLENIYPSAAAGDTETLLFTGDKTFRTIGLDEANIGASGSAVTLDLSGSTTATTGFLRWAPYSYDGATWSNLDPFAYRSELESDLGPVFTSGQVQSLAAGDTDFDEALAQTGAINLAVNFYTSLYSGAVTLLQNGSTVLSSGTLNNGAHGLPGEPAVFIVNEILGDIQNFYIRISLSNLTLTATLYDELEAVASSAWVTLAAGRGHIMEALGQIVQGETASSTTLALNQLQYATQLSGDLSSLLNAGALDYTYMSTIGESELYGPAANIFAVTYYAAYRGVYKIYSAYRYFSGVTPTVPRLVNSIIEDYQTWLWLAYAGQVSLAVGSFAYAWGTGKITPGSPEFADKLAFEISDIIVDTIVFVIISVATTSVVLGAMAVLNIIDAVIALICEAAKVKPGSETDQWVCGGITGALVKALTYVINDYTELADLTHDGRLDSDMSTPTVIQNTATPGFAVGNTISLTTSITSTLYFGHPNWMGYAYAATQLTDDNLNDSTFAYQLQTETADIPLDLNGTNWDAIGGSDVDAGDIPTGPRFRQNFSASVGYTPAKDEAGVNSGLKISLAEGYAMKAQDCWLIVEPVCWIETTRDTNQTDLSGDLLFDLFPETLDDFHSLALVDSDSYRLDWDSNFPTLADADGDGLRSKLAGGADPDDSRADSDGDGLGDDFEQQNGFDYTTADGDNDGLTDYWEAYYLTDPYEADTDGDGLADSEEALHPNWNYPYENSDSSNTNPPPGAPSQSPYMGGWEIVYAYSGATPLKSWVSANPVDFDTDNDGIDDLREEIYGYNPQAASALAVLSLHATVQASSGSTTYPVPYATPGSTLAYTAVVTNELTDRWARGLLQAEFPTDTVRQTTELGVVQPLQQLNLNGTTSAANSGLSASGTVSMTLRSGAVVVGDDDRVLWLHLNESTGAKTFIDSSVYNQEAKCTACPAANGDYLSFSPTSNSTQQVLVVPTTSLTPQSFTLGLWVRVNTPGSITLYEMETVAGGVGEPNFALELANSSINLVVQKNIYNTNQTVATGRWNHVLVTYDRSSKQTTLYVNGSQKWQQATATINYGSLLFDFTLGAGDSGTKFDLDEVELYDRVLDATEIELLFSQPVLDVNFATLADDSPSGNSLTCAAGSTCPGTSSSGGSFSQKQYVNAGGSALDFSGDAFTFSAWINPQTRGTPFDNQAVSAYNSLVGAYPRVNDSNYDWQGVFGAADSSNHAKVAPTLLVNPKGQMRLFMGNGTTTCHLDTAEGLIDYGTWQHVTVSYDGETASFYINGNLAAQSNKDCANITPANLGQITVGRGSALGTLYWHYVSFSDGKDSGDYELRINFDSDSSSGNIWEGSAASGGSTVGNILKAYFIPDDSSHWWHFWEDDSSPSNADYHHCSVGCDDSYVKETVTNRDIGSFSSNFDQVDITQVDWAEGTLYWTLSNDFFMGSINEFKAYTRAFSDDDALKLYEASYDGLYFTFDEPPGANTFADAYDDSTPASCDYAAGSCPDGGVAGINNQAVAFNGGTDYLQLPQTDLLKTLYSGFTIAAWIKPDKVNGIQRILTASRQTSVNGFGFGLNGDKLRFTTFGVKDYDSGSAVKAGQWQHVAVVFDDLFTAAFYVNGVHIGNVTGIAPAAPNSDDPYRIGAGTLNNFTDTIDEMFDGRIDDLVVVKRPLNTAGIQDLMASAPVLTLHLDEDLATTAFVNEVGTASFAQCDSASACPAAGDKGQIRESVVFDGIDDILTAPIVTSSGAAFNGLSEFTVGLWVNPTEIKSDYQPLIALENDTGGERNFGLFIHPGSMDINMSMSNSACTAYLGRTAFNNPLLQHQWNHVMYTFDGTTQRLYINGTQRTSNTPGDSPCLSNNAVKIGSELNHYVPFAGGIDEVTIFSRALSGLEVAETFAYQSAWFDVKETHAVTIDDDNPTIGLDLPFPYLPPGETVLKINAQDPTSEVVRVRYAINGPAQNATSTNGVWTLSYDFQYEGTYGVVLEATDSVGNVTSVIETVYVDTQPPNGIAGSFPPHTLQDGVLYWNNILVNDTASTVGANSGVDKSSVMVTVRDRHGDIVVAPVQATWVSGVSYNAAIPFTFDPYGEYTLGVSFADLVGNRSSFDWPAVLENRGPHGDVLLHAGTTITPGLTITGIASDVEHVWQNRSVHLHFEEESGSQEFIDPSRNELVASCADSPGQCPTAGASGKHGSAISLNGSQSLTLAGSAGGSDTISTTLESRLGLYDDSFTVMAWVNGTSWSQAQAILGVAAADPSDDMSIGFLNGRPGIGFNGGSVVAAQQVPTGTWAHVAYSYDLESGTVSVYVNGELEEAVSGHLPYVGQDVSVTIGQLRNTAYFNGLIDELVIYPQTLTADQIYDIANPVDSGLSQVEVRFRHVDEQDQSEEDGNWQEATFSSGTTGDIHRLWTYTVPQGLSGSYKIDVRVTDSYGVTRTADNQPTADTAVLANKRYVPGVWTGMTRDAAGIRRTFMPVIAGGP